MSLLYHPQVGTIVRVDLNEGFRIPEMRKRRPAVILSAPLLGRDQLCTIVPLSTSKSRTLRDYHCEIELDPPLPFPYGAKLMWAKADMILTVAFHRLKLLEAGRGPDGDRLYDIRVLGAEKMAEMRDCVRRSLGL